MSSFFIALKIILGIIGAIIVAVIAVALFVYLIWMILNPSEAKRIVKKIFNWLSEWFSFLKPSKSKKSGISRWLTIGIPFGLISFLVGIYFLFFRNFNFREDLDRPWWHWFVFGLVIFIVLLMVILNYSKDTSTSTSNLPILSKINFYLKRFATWWKSWNVPKWIKSLFWIVLVFLLFWFGIDYLRGIKNLNKSNNNTSESYDNNSGVSVKNYPKLNMNGQNVMKAGEFKKFTIEYDGPTISWDIAGSDTVSLYFEKSEDKTRNWKLKIWRDKKGIKQYKFYPYKPPILAALIGSVYIKTEKDAIVIVSTK
jgi:hypothetical protein